MSHLKNNSHHLFTYWKVLKSEVNSRLWNDKTSSYDDVYFNTKHILYKMYKSIYARLPT